MREIDGLIVLIQREDEEFAAEAAPGDEEFPEEGTVHSGVRMVEEIDEVLNEIINNYAGYEFERSVIELPNYHEKCSA